MKRYTAAQARQRFAEVLDAAERGQPVLVERRGVSFVVQAQRVRRLRGQRRKSLILYLDPAVAGRIRLRAGATAGQLTEDHGVAVDDPPSTERFSRALEVSSLLVAQTRLRGWRLATSDRELLRRLGPEATVEL